MTIASPQNSPRPSRRRAALVAFSSGILVFAAIAILASRSLRRIETDTAAVDHTRIVLAHLMAARRQIDAAAGSWSGYVITDDRSEKGRYGRTGFAMRAEVEALRALTKDDPAERNDVGLLSGDVEAWRATLDAAVGDFDRNGFLRKSQAAFGDRARAGARALRQTLDRMERRENELLDRRQRAARAGARATDSIVIFGSVIGVLLLSVAAWSAGREAEGRRRAENVVRMSEERLRLLVESVRDYAIFLLDPGGQVLTWPDSAKRIQGFESAEVLGRAHTIFYTPEDARLGVPEEFLETTRLEGRAENEGWRVRKDGSRFWADVVMTAVVSDGEVVGFAHVTRDMTERRAAQERISALHERLRRQAAELENANAELQAFCYSVSHDLRSPLRAIDGFSQALLEDAAPRLDEEGRRLLGRVRAAAGRMGDLIDALLDLSRVTRQPLDRAKVDLSELARSVSGELARTEPGRSVSVEIAPGLEAEGDPRLLALVLQNLLGNAWKFTSGNPSASIAFGAEGSEPPVYFVRDDGAGFDMRYAEQLFAPFHRLHGAEFPGTGIGLATVARIIQRHGGKIWAEGRVGEGATFFFTL